MLGISRSTGCQRFAALVYDHEVELAELDAAPVLAGPVDPVKDGVGGREPGLELAKGLQRGLTGAGQGQVGDVGRKGDVPCLAMEP
jgi:hypothetical protein